MWQAEDFKDEYENWESNASLLYDFLNIYQLEWPALSCEWTELVTLKESKERVARFLLGTLASESADNYIYMLEMDYLDEEEVVPVESRKMSKHIDRVGFNYGRERKKFRLLKRIHSASGEIQKLRKSPSCHLAAAMTANGSIIVFDASSEIASGQYPVGSLKENEGAEFIHKVLTGHSTSGWGLAWSHYNQNELFTTADDLSLCIWDISKSDKPQRFIKCGHDKPPQAVVAHRQNAALFFTAGDDGRILLWDSRVSEDSKAWLAVCNPREDISFNAIDQNPFYDWLIAAGSTEHDVTLYDVRKCSYPTASMKGHSDAVNAVSFSPLHAYLLASGSADARANIWDLRDIGCEQTEEMEADGSPELLFSHGGHEASIQDISWSPGSDSALCSVDDNNQLYVWQMETSVFFRDDEAEEGSEDETYKADRYLVEP